MFKYAWLQNTSSVWILGHWSGYLFTMGDELHEGIPPPSHFGLSQQMFERWSQMDCWQIIWNVNQSPVCSQAILCGLIPFYFPVPTLLGPRQAFCWLWESVSQLLPGIFPYPPSFLPSSFPFLSSSLPSFPPSLVLCFALEIWSLVCSSVGPVLNCVSKASINDSMLSIELWVYSSMLSQWDNFFVKLLVIFQDLD